MTSLIFGFFAAAYYTKSLESEKLNGSNGHFFSTDQIFTFWVLMLKIYFKRQACLHGSALHSHCVTVNAIIMKE